MSAARGALIEIAARAAADADAEFDFVLEQPSAELLPDRDRRRRVLEQEKKRLLQRDVHVLVAMAEEGSLSADVLDGMIRKGVPLDAEDSHGMTPLHEAAFEGHVGAAIALLEGGADRALLDEDGCTPAALAVRMGHEHLLGCFPGAWDPVLGLQEKPEPRRPPGQG